METKVKKFMQSINEMGRPRQMMVDLVTVLTETIQEHLWKVFAYHNTRQRDVAGWMTSLNKHLPRLRVFNIQKGTKSDLNLDKEELNDLLADTCFGNERDSDVLNHNWHSEGYPLVSLTEQKKEALLKLAEKYVDYILDENLGSFTVSKEELL